MGDYIYIIDCALGRTILMKINKAVNNISGQYLSWLFTVYKGIDRRQYQNMIYCFGIKDVDLNSKIALSALANFNRHCRQNSQHLQMANQPV